MSAAATRAIMLYFYIILSLFKCHTNFLTSEDVSVKILTENLSSLIINFVLGVNHNTIFSSSFEEHFANYLRVARVYKYQLRHRFFLVLEKISYFVS
jgi:hypothetical protein